MYFENIFYIFYSLEFYLFSLIDYSRYNFLFMLPNGLNLKDLEDFLYNFPNHLLQS